MHVFFRSYFDAPAVEEEEEKEHRGGFSAEDKKLIKVNIQCFVYLIIHKMLIKH